MKDMYIALVFLCCFVWLGGQISPSMELVGLPACDAYAGEAATKVVNGTVHFTYLARTGNLGQIIMSVSGVKHLSSIHIK